MSAFELLIAGEQLMFYETFRLHTTGSIEVTTLTRPGGWHFGINMEIDIDKRGRPNDVNIFILISYAA